MTLPARSRRRLLGLELAPDLALEKLITERLQKRGIRLTDRILRQAMVPLGAEVLPNENGTAPGPLFGGASDSSRAFARICFLLPGPPRELRPMFVELPFFRSFTRSFGRSPDFGSRGYPNRRDGGVLRRGSGRETNLLALPGLELGYCARMGEVDLR